MTMQLFALIADWRKRRNAILELSNLSDLTLRDIGVVRADIPRLVEEAISRARAREAASQQMRVQVCTRQSTGLC